MFILGHEGTPNLSNCGSNRTCEENIFPQALSPAADTGPPQPGSIWSSSPNTVRQETLPSPLHGPEKGMYPCGLDRVPSPDPCSPGAVESDLLPLPPPLPLTPHSPLPGSSQSELQAGPERPLWPVPPREIGGRCGSPETLGPHQGHTASGT